MFSTAGQITNRYTQLPNLLLFFGTTLFHRSRLARSFLVLRAAFLSSFITPPRHENLSSVGSESSMKYNVRKTHGLDSLGWGPRLRLRFGHHTPDEYYEAVVAKLVDAQCGWLDVGCSSSIFPDNDVLAKILANRCKLLVGIDPDDTLNENPFVHERVKTTIDNFHRSSCFDLVTLRMVAEHLADPKSAVNSLSHLTKPGGKVVVYTVNQWSPVSVIARIAPFRLHHYIKRLLWRIDEKDTFPVTYKMNTRSRLSRLFEENGFREIGFSYLDDCRTLGRFRFAASCGTHAVEISPGPGIEVPRELPSRRL